MASLADVVFGVLDDARARQQRRQLRVTTAAAAAMSDTSGPRREQVLECN